jgi:MFS family permease
MDKVEPALRDDIEFREFVWSGSNSLDARRLAADDLRTYLRTNLSEAPDACQLLVAHSHGGVVAFNAVTREGGTGSHQLDGILSLGTPYLTIEENTENKFNVLMFSFLPTATFLILLAFLITLAAAGFYSTAAWLSAMIAGLFIGHRVIQLNARRAPLRHAADTLLALCCAAAVWFSFAAASSWFSLWHLAAGALNYWGQFAHYSCGVIGACLSIFILLTTRAAASEGRGGEAFMLRDTVSIFLSLAGRAVIAFAAVWAFTSDRASLNNLAVFFLFWPIVSFFVAGVLSGTFSDSNSVKHIPRRFIDFHTLLNKETTTPELPCSLNAIRLPDDEASLAIAASLIAREVSDLFAAISWKFVQLQRIPRWLIVVLFALGLGMVALGVHNVYASGATGWLPYVVGAILPLGIACFFLIAVGLFLTTCLFALSLLTIGLIALAIGPDVNRMLPAVRFYCEPLPRCVRTDLCRFELQWVPPEARSHLPLRHFLHDLEPVRQQVAEWITAKGKLSGSKN